MDESLKFSITVVVAIFGWWFVHRLSYQRERKNKRDDKRIEYMISVFEDLNKLRAKSNTLKIAEASDLLINISTKIELYGNQPQIEQMRLLASGITSNAGDMSAAWSLIDTLRDDIRADLNLSGVESSVATFYLKKD